MGAAVGMRRALHLPCGSHSGHFAAPLLLVERQRLPEPDSGVMLPASLAGCVTLGRSYQVAPWLPHRYNSDNSACLSFCGTGKQTVCTWLLETFSLPVRLSRE